MSVVKKIFLLGFLCSVVWNPIFSGKKSLKGGDPYLLSSEELEELSEESVDPKLKNMNIKDKNNFFLEEILKEDFNLANIVWLLRFGGVNVNSRFKNGLTILHILVLKGNKLLIKLLLEAGADKKLTASIENWTPYNFAKILGYDDIAIILE